MVRFIFIVMNYFFFEFWVLDYFGNWVGWSEMDDFIVKRLGI